MHGWLKI